MHDGCDNGRGEYVEKRGEEKRREEKWSSKDRPRKRRSRSCES